MGAVPSCASNGRQLLAASDAGNLDVVREVLEAKPELVKYCTFSSHFNAIHHAAERGHIIVLETIFEVLSLASKADDGPCMGDLKPIPHFYTPGMWGRVLKEAANARSSSGQTPLILACMNGHAACAQFLIAHGADVFVVDRFLQRSAIHHAAAFGHAGVLRVLTSDATVVRSEDGPLPLRDVRVHDMSGQCRYIDSRAENGLTALHLAAAGGELECVRTLLDAGASMMVRTVDLEMASDLMPPAGSTPLHLAAHRGHVAILQAMLQAQADAMGTWGLAGREGADRRRAWEGDGRIDLRSVTNSQRQLPYHVAWQRGFRQAASVLNPTVSLDQALESVREMDEGFGPQKLKTLAAYALRRGLLEWLETYKVEKEGARLVREQRQKEESDTRPGTQGSHLAPAVAERLGRRSGQPATAGGTQGGGRGAETLVPMARTSPMTPVVETAESGSPLAAGPASRSRAEDNGLPTGDAGSTTPPEHASAAASVAVRLRGVSPLPLQSPFASWESSAPEGAAAPGPAEGGRDKAGTRSGQRRRSSLRVDLPLVQPARSLAAPDQRQQSLPEPMPGPRPSWRSLRVDACGPGEAIPDTAGPLSPAPSGVSLPPAASRARLFTFRRRSSVGQVLTRRTSSQHELLARAASITGFDEFYGADEDCGICLEEGHDVAINGCRHRLCVDCAFRLCEVAKKPPLCPFCRHCIQGFHVLARPA